MLSVLLQNRITPAGAGKTLCPLGQDVDKPDHPRRCGENEWTDLNNKIGIGSPPQVRGKRLLCFIGVARRRITPAGAGKTTVVRFFEFIEQDHPRRCGENSTV